jgi:hypothetical protein
MTKYALLYEDTNGLSYIGSFIGKNHYKIKFVMYRYLKSLMVKSGYDIELNSVLFCVHAIRSNKKYVYVGETDKIESEIGEFKSINRVYRASDEGKSKLMEKLRVAGEVPYKHTHSYREQYDREDISMSESDSEFDSNEYN